MTQEIKLEEVEHIPLKYLGTLLACNLGINPKKHMHINTYYNHRDVLLKYGWDISTKPTCVPVRAKQHQIEDQKE